MKKNVIEIILISGMIMCFLMAGVLIRSEAKKEIVLVNDISSPKELRVVSTNEKDISSARGSYFIFFGSYESSSSSNNKFIRMLARFNNEDYRVIEVPISIVRFNISDNKSPYIKIKCSRDYVNKGDYSIDGFKIEYITIYCNEIDIPENISILI